MKTNRLVAALGASALLALPVVANADRPANPGSQGQGKSKRCKTIHPGFVVTGTLVTLQQDDPQTTGVNEGAVTITVRNANAHARKSGEIADQNPNRKGVQVRGATFTVDNDADPWKLQLSGFATPDTPSPGDKVRIIGRIAYTKKKCASAGTSLADRYGDVNVRKVKVVDSDPDA